jgi:hypothetical protein
MTRRIKLIERLQELYSEIELIKREIIKETNLEKLKEKILLLKLLVDL